VADPGHVTRSEEQPAFFHGYEYVRGQKLGVIKLNPQVAERLAKDGVRETLHPRHLPMLIKPKPWLSHDQGGYLYNRSRMFASIPAVWFV
jgi:DNA-directed RNA polymerase